MFNLKKGYRAGEVSGGQIIKGLVYKVQTLIVSTGKQPVHIFALCFHKFPNKLGDARREKEKRDGETKGHLPSLYQEEIRWGGGKSGRLNS